MANQESIRKANAVQKELNDSLSESNAQQKRLNDSLNDSYAQQQQLLNDSLNESNQKLQQSNTQLEEFAHMASHDLKSPLRVITGFSSLLKRKISQRAEEKEMQYLDFIIKGGNNLSVMIDDMLAYAKDGAKKVKLTETDLNLIMKDFLVEMNQVAEEQSVSLNLNTTFPVVIADGIKLKRVFQNIVSNALKFNDKEKTERFVNISYKELSKAYQFEIADNGIGIPDTKQDIFKPFTYLNSNENYKGTGMGLAMCKNIIEQHGGKIWYESEEGVGTTFYFTIKK